MSKAVGKSELIEAVTAKLESRMEERMGGLPSKETEERLARDEELHPVNDVDFFDFCHEAFVKKGVGIEYYIRKDGSYKTTLPPPLSWDSLRKKFGPGHYIVTAKDRVTKEFKKQKTEMLDEMPIEEIEDASSTPFQFGASAPSQTQDLTSILGLMQRNDDRRAASDREDRLREEDRRREDKEKDEARRREDRENRSDLIKTLLAAAPVLFPVLLPKKEDTSPLVLDFMKENMRSQEAQNLRMMDQIQKVLMSPKTETSPMELIKMLQEAEDRGWKKREKISEEIDEKAEQRAEEMASSGGEKEDSTLALVLKNLGPGIAALLAGRGTPEVLQGEASIAAGTLPAPEPTSVANGNRDGYGAVVETVPPVKAPPTKDERDQQTIIKTVVPFIAEQYLRIQQGRNVDPGGAARESLQLLKTKGFTQARVNQLFSREILFGVLRAYKVPNTFDSWFNSYYEALAVTEAPTPLRDRSKPVLKPLKTATKPSDGNGPGKPDASPGTAPSGITRLEPSSSVHPTSVANGDRDGFGTVESGASAGGPTEVTSSVVS